MNSSAPVKIFIGSGEASLLERKTAIYSLRKNSKRDLDIYVFNGTHNAIERNNEPPVLAPMSLRIKYKNYTEFSIYRFLIPELCNHQGKAIFIDSDTICLADVGELFDTPMGDNDVLAVKGNYRGTDRWALSVALFNCSTCRFDLEKIFDEIDQGLYTYTDFASLTSKYLAYHPMKIGELDENWNVFDRWDNKTKLIHYTNLDQQPWKYANHLYGDLWHQYFHEAIKAGAVTKEDINKSISRAYVRRNITKGNFSLLGLGRAEAYAKQALLPAKTLAKKILKR